jgi:glycosyltransferase involved in cell wall biosynthesis
MISIVTPAYNEARNLPVMYEKIAAILDSLAEDWEWVIVDDHSPDETFGVISEIAGRNGRVRGVRFARNLGSHTAIACGLDLAKGDCAVVMAGDLQDPPETLPELLRKWRDGAQVVWAVRDTREGEKESTLLFSRLFYWVMRRVAGMKEVPGKGADFLLMDRAVIDSVVRFRERNANIFVLTTWMGFRQDSILYAKRARLHGSSGWTLKKKLKMVVDSVTSFTYFPIRLMSYAGVLVAALGFLYAGFIIVNGVRGNPPTGWSSLMVVVLVLGGFQMVMLGILGEYLWRALDESRGRPRYWIESAVGACDEVRR